MTFATSTQARELIPGNASRKSLIFQNEDASDAVFIKLEGFNNLSVSSTDHDHRIGPGGSISFDLNVDGKQAVQGRWTVIAAANTPRVSFLETEDVTR